MGFERNASLRTQTPPARDFLCRAPPLAHIALFFLVRFLRVSVCFLSQESCIVCRFVPGSLDVARAK